MWQSIINWSIFAVLDASITVQGALPDGDAEADALLRGVKSKAMYGRVREDVDRMKVSKQLF